MSNGIIRMLRNAPTGRARWVWLVGGAAAAVVVVMLAGFALTRGSDATAQVGPEPTSSQPTASATGTPAPSAASDGLALGSVVATFTGDSLEVTDAPAGAALTILTRWSAYGSPLTLLAIDSAEVDGDTWYEVLVPVQPNGTTGWIRASDVDLSSTDVRIDIYLAEHELVLTQGGEQVLTTGIVAGDPEASPTPVGVYSLTDPLDYSANTTGRYGAYALGLSGFSETLDSFDGGPPQIAIHGTNSPELIGQSVSNGCIRVTNEAITQIAGIAGLGTPVVVHATHGD